MIYEIGSYDTDTLKYMAKYLVSATPLAAAIEKEIFQREEEERKQKWEDMIDYSCCP